MRMSGTAEAGNSPSDPVVGFLHWRNGEEVCARVLGNFHELNLISS